MNENDVLCGRGEVLESLEELMDELANRADWENCTLPRYPEGAARFAWFNCLRKPENPTAAVTVDAHY